MEGSPRVLYVNLLSISLPYVLKVRVSAGPVWGFKLGPLNSSAKLDPAFSLVLTCMISDSLRRRLEFTESVPHP